MATIDDLVSRVEDDLLRTDLTSQVFTAINRAIEHYWDTPTWFNQEEATSFTTVSAQQQYTTSDGWPSDMAKPVILKASITTGNEYQLHKRTFQYIQEVSVTSNYTGFPYDYAVFKESLWLYPIPSGNYTISVFYFKNYSELANGESNDWTNNARDLIESRARWWICSRILKDREDASAAKAEEMEALTKIMSKSRRYKNTPSSIRPSDF